MTLEDILKDSSGLDDSDDDIFKSGAQMDTSSEEETIVREKSYEISRM